MNNPLIFDLACGYGPRAYKMIPKGYRYIGGDLPSVVDDIHEELDKQKGYDDLKAMYKCVDVTDTQAVREAVKEEEGPVTIVTQGLITYLDREQKHLLASNMHKLLEARGGCWMIPDASPDQMLKTTFRGVMGNDFFVKIVCGIRDKVLKRDEAKINWKTTDEIVAGLKEEGFKVEVLPLYEEDMDLHVFEHLSKEKAERLKEAWKSLNFIIATV